MKTRNKAKSNGRKQNNSSGGRNAVIVLDPEASPLYDIANYFLFKSAKEGENGEPMSNMKLQKLVYYAQGLHLVLFNSPLFPEKIKAWEHGPVVPQLYHKYKKCGAGGIPCDGSFKISKIKKSTRNFLDEVYTVFGQFSAIGLRDLTHSDTCWKEARPSNGEITEAAMTSCLKKYVKASQ